MVCKDDLVLTKEDAKRQVSLPALAAVVSVGHDLIVSAAGAPITYVGQPGDKSLVSVSEVGYESSSAGYLVGTQYKA